MFKKATQIFVKIVFLLLASQVPVMAKEVGKTPYEHMPIDTFIAGFPLEMLIILGIVAYALGMIYVLNAAHLKSRE